MGGRERGRWEEDEEEGGERRSLQACVAQCQDKLCLNCLSVCLHNLMHKFKGEGEKGF